MKIRPTNNVELYLGSINEETKKSFTYEKLVKVISIFQDSRTKSVPVCISDVEFLSGSIYREKGWKVSAINYPRVDVTKKEIDKFMVDLATVLIAALKQNRICVVGSHRTVMIER